MLSLKKESSLSGFMRSMVGIPLLVSSVSLYVTSDANNRGRYGGDVCCLDDARWRVLLLITQMFCSDDDEAKIIPFCLWIAVCCVVFTFSMPHASAHAICEAARRLPCPCQ